MVWVSAMPANATTPINNLIHYIKAINWKGYQPFIQRKSNCKCKEIINSLSASCRVIMEYLNAQVNKENIMKENEFHKCKCTWSCNNKCTDAMKNLKIYWSVMLQKFLNDESPKNEDYYTNCPQCESIREMARKWQEEISNQDKLDNLDVSVISKINSEAFTACSDIKSLKDAFEKENKRKNEDRSTKKNDHRELRRDYLLTRKISSTNITEKHNESSSPSTVISSMGEELFETDDISSQFNTIKEVKSTINGIIKTRPSLTEYEFEECNPNEIELPKSVAVLFNFNRPQIRLADYPGIETQDSESTFVTYESSKIQISEIDCVSNSGEFRMELKKMLDEYSLRKKNIKKAQRKNRSLKVELNNLVNRRRRCNSDKCINNPLRSIQKVEVEELKPTLENTDSDMTITIKNVSNQKFRYISIIQIKHKSNQLHCKTLEDCWETNNPTYVLNRVHSKLNAMLKREIGVLCKKTIKIQTFQRSTKNPMSSSDILI